jgi:hypothetical protein
LHRINQKCFQVQQKIGKDICQKAGAPFRFAHVSQQDLVRFFEPKARRRFCRIFTNPQETAACYRFWYRNIQEVFAPRMPTIRPYFAEKSAATRPYFAEENRPFPQGPKEMFP